LADPGEDTAVSPGAVLFQRQLAFEGVEDRLDPLAHPQ
jgi:hypothetical protein